METTATTDEAQAFRRCVRELAALSTLAAAWSRSEPREITDGLSQVLSRSLSLAFVYVRVFEAGGAPLESLRRPGESLPEAEARRIGETLEPLLAPGNAVPTPTLANPFGEGLLQLAVIPIGWGGDCGVLVAASEQPEFPSQTDRLLLGVATNQAAVVLQQRRMEAQLRRSERELADFFDNATVGLHWAGPDGTILRANQAELNLLGYSREEYVGRNISDFHADRQVVDEVMRRLQAGEELEELEVRLRCKDGSLKHVLISSNVLWRDGQFIHTRCFTRDITDRKRAERALRESEEQFRALFEQTTGGIVQTDLAGRFVLVNDRYCQIVGRSREELLGLCMQDITHPDDPPGNAAQFVALAEGRGPDFVVEQRYVRPDGSHVWVQNQVSAIHDVQGEVQSLTAAVTDVTQRKQAVEALREADRRKDEFLAQLAHELRNPLAPVRNAVQVLRLKGSDAPEARWGRDVIERQVEHLTRMIDDLLDVSRITRNALELRRQRVELAAVIHAAVESSRPNIEECEHTLTVTLPPDPIYLHADLVRLAQVFLNLLNNAAKFTERGGRIQLTAERDGADVLVRVKDSGVGIPAEQLPRLFEMFFQVDRSSERSQGGLGIGLSLVKRLVDLHGGRVEARSDGALKGSEFEVRLPVLIEEPKPVSVPEPAGGHTQGDGYRVLVVDDNRDAADTLAMVLRLMGNEVHTAYGGVEGVEAAERFRPDVMLLDIGMPYLNGQDACRRIRQQSWGRHIVVVALTGWGQEEDRRLTAEAGFDSHLVKPVNPAALVELLASLKTKVRVRGRAGSAT